MPVMAVVEASRELQRLSFSFRERVSACRDNFSSRATDNCWGRERGTEDKHCKNRFKDCREWSGKDAPSDKSTAVQREGKGDDASEKSSLLVKRIIYQEC